VDYVDLEVRILKKEENRYPVEITFNGDLEFPRGMLSAKLPVLTAGFASPEDGEALFQWLFSDEALKTAWAKARGLRPLRRIRLRIDEDAPELHQIPWELLRDSGEGGVALDLAAMDATPFSRYIAGSWVPGTPILKRPIRMLLAVSNPTNAEYYGLTAIDPEAELSLLQDALAGSWSICRAPVLCKLLKRRFAAGYTFFISLAMEVIPKEPRCFISAISRERLSW
jgi:hypothetical protein